MKRAKDEVGERAKMRATAQVGGNVGGAGGREARYFALPGGAGAAKTKSSPPWFQIQRYSVIQCRRGCPTLQARSAIFGREKKVFGYETALLLASGPIGAQLSSSTSADSVVISPPGAGSTLIEHDIGQSTWSGTWALKELLYAGADPATYTHMDGPHRGIGPIRVNWSTPRSPNFPSHPP